MLFIRVLYELCIHVNFINFLRGRSRNFYIKMLQRGEEIAYFSKFNYTRSEFHFYVMADDYLQYMSF